MVESRWPWRLLATFQTHRTVTLTVTGKKRITSRSQRPVIEPLGHNVVPLDVRLRVDDVEDTLGHYVVPHWTHGKRVGKILIRKPA
jgi:hypothetical protein